VDTGGVGGQVQRGQTTIRTMLVRKGGDTAIEGTAGKMEGVGCALNSTYMPARANVIVTRASTTP
jgi:hypothetical protein